MRGASICIIGSLGAAVHAGAEPLIEGRVRLPSGAPAAGAQVRLFDQADLRAAPLTTTTDRSGHFTLPLAALAGALPERFELGANYPNPFNPSTVIPYQLPASMHVRLEVFNMLGQQVATLVDEERPAGFHTTSWDATDAAGSAVGAGVYLYRLSGDGVQATRSMLLIDGQAGIASSRGGSTSLGKSAAPAEGETRPVYGLTVSGPGLVPYVNPAFRVDQGLAPLDLVVEAPGVAPRGKAASSGGILGDVDNTGAVDFFDALLVALFSLDSSIVMPNDGDISLGDVNADGQVDLSDAWVIAAWLNDPADPAMPAGIGEPVGPALPSLSPDPSTVTFADDGGWHRFTVQADEPVSVVANPEGTGRLLEITTRHGRGNFCPAEAEDDVSREDGQTLYLSGCSSGQARVELRRGSDGTVLRTYTFEVTGIPADLVVESVSVSDSTLTPGQSFTLTATVRNQGTAGAAATTLRYYRSSNRTISTRDTEAGSDAVGALAAEGASAESISLTAPSAEGTWYYGACVVSVEGERGGNNCSTGVRAIVKEPDATPVTIPDANLRAAIEEALGKASGAPITKAELRSLTRLEANDSGISDLTGLESATTLSYLNLSSWPSDDLPDNNITDISPLAGLTSLKTLWLGDNNITDISALSGLTDLERLDLQSNSISDISALSGLTKLGFLKLGYNNLTLFDYSLTPTPENSGIRDISPLAGLTNLTALELQYNSIEDISALSDLTKLWHLILQVNPISDISALSGMTSLSNLVLGANNIVDIPALSGLTNLRWLVLEANSIADLSSLAGLTKLESLDLDRNDITDVSALSGLANLERLNLSDNSIEDIKALSGMTNLTELDLWFNKVTDISPLFGLTNLANLELRWNPLNDSSLDDHIPALQGRGVMVLFTPLGKGDFDIELVFLDSFTEDQKDVLRLVARRWMSVITEDLQDHEFAQGWSGRCGDHSYAIPSGERIDDLRIYMTTFKGDQAVGWGGPTLLRDETHLPVVGCMGFDLERANLLITGLHEVGHVLGFGTVWGPFSYYQNPPNGDQHFSGPLAIAAFDDAGGGDYAGAKVPLSDPAHWRGEVFEWGELMLPWGGAALSAITVQSLADLGYGVDVTVADPYAIHAHGAAAKASAKIAAAVPSIPGVTPADADPHWPGSIGRSLYLLPRDDRLAGRPESAAWIGGHGFDRSDGRLMRPFSCGAGLRRGPVHVVDPQGRIVSTLGD